jgi:hypothetical protein
MTLGRPDVGHEKLGLCAIFIFFIVVGYDRKVTTWSPAD